MRSSSELVKSMEQRELMRVSVVYALPERQVIARLEIESGATVGDVLEASGLSSQVANLAEASCAIFGRPVARAQTVRSGDRIEILRPLLIDPKEGRRRAASSARAKRP